MTPDELDQLMAESTRQFNDLKVEQGSNEVRHEQIVTNLAQLQGEYEAYKTLKQTLMEREAFVQNPPETVIDPKPKKEKVASGN